MLKPFCGLSDKEKAELLRGKTNPLPLPDEIIEDELYERLEPKEPDIADHSLFKGLVIADGPEELPPEPDPVIGTRIVDNFGITKQWSGSHWVTITAHHLEMEAHQAREAELLTMRPDIPRETDKPGKITNVYFIHTLEPDGTLQLRDTRGYRGSAIQYATSLLRRFKKTPRLIRITNKNSNYVLDMYWSPPSNLS